MQALIGLSFMEFNFKRDILDDDEALYTAYYGFEDLAGSICESYPTAVLWVSGDNFLREMNICIEFDLSAHRSIVACFTAYYGLRTAEELCYSVPHFEFHVGNTTLKNMEFINKFFKLEKEWIDKMYNIPAVLENKSFIFNKKFPMMTYLNHIQSLINGLNKDANTGPLYVNCLKTDFEIYMLES